MAMRGIGCFVVLIAVLSACSDSNAPQGRNPSGAQTAAVEQASGLPRILETFNVGKDVFVRALAVDSKNGALWVGTSLGVHEIDLATRAVRRTITREQGLANEYVFAILAERDGGVWFGTNGGGMTHLRDTQTRTYFPMHGLADYWVYAFARQSNGALWVGTWAGANRFEPDTGRFTTYLKELVNEWVYGIGVDSRDRVWFGTEGGVSMFDGKQWYAWTHDQGLGAPNNDKLPISTNTGLGTRSRHDLSVLADGSPTYNPNYVFCIHVDSRDRVWAGTWGGGASRFDGEGWKNLTTHDGLAGDVVFAITSDRYGNLWFGTDRGLSRYDGHAWQTFGKDQGMPGDNVYAVAATPDGEVWAGTRGGVARIGYGSAETGNGGQEGG